MNICCEFPITKAVKSKRNEPKVMPALAQKKNHVADSQSFARCLTNNIRAPKKLMNSGRITFSCFCSRENTQQKTENKQGESTTHYRMNNFP